MRKDSRRWAEAYAPYATAIIFKKKYPEKAFGRVVREIGELEHLVRWAMRTALF